MLTLYHAPLSRSSRVLWLLEELGASYDVAYIDIVRQSGEGRQDPANPNLLKQAPTLKDGEAMIHESVVIFIHLVDSFPAAGLAPAPGAPDRAAFMAWMGLYNAILEPVVTANFRGAPTPVQVEAYAALDGVWRGALEKGPYLMGENFSAADILFGSLLMWFRTAMPDHKDYDDWIARLASRPALARARLREHPPK